MVISQHCLVTGGSRGTGLALAILLARRGAHVSIVARDQPRLDKGLEELEARDPHFPHRCLAVMSDFTVLRGFYLL